MDHGPCMNHDHHHHADDLIDRSKRCIFLSLKLIMILKSPLPSRCPHAHAHVSTPKIRFEWADLQLDDSLLWRLYVYIVVKIALWPLWPLWPLCCCVAVLLCCCIVVLLRCCVAGLLGCMLLVYGPPIELGRFKCDGNTDGWSQSAASCS